MPNLLKALALPAEASRQAPERLPRPTGNGTVPSEGFRRLLNQAEAHTAAPKANPAPPPPPPPQPSPQPLTEQPRPLAGHESSDPAMGGSRPAIKAAAPTRPKLATAVHGLDAEPPPEPLDTPPAQAQRVSGEWPPAEQADPSLLQPTAPPHAQAWLLAPALAALNAAMAGAETAAADPRAAGSGPGHDGNALADSQANALRADGRWPTAAPGVAASAEQAMSWPGQAALRRASDATASPAGAALASPLPDSAVAAATNAATPALPGSGVAASTLGGRSTRPADGPSEYTLLASDKSPDPGLALGARAHWEPAPVATQRIDSMRPPALIASASVLPDPAAPAAASGAAGAAHAVALAAISSAEPATPASAPTAPSPAATAARPAGPQASALSPRPGANGAAIVDSIVDSIVDANAGANAGANAAAASSGSAFDGGAGPVVQADARGPSARGSAGQRRGGDAAHDTGQVIAPSAPTASDPLSNTGPAPGLLAVADASPTPLPMAAHTPSPPPPALLPNATGTAPIQAGASGATDAAPAGREAQIRAAINSAEFGPALGLQISTMARDGTQQARLHLNPAEMGPISVTIALDGRGARVDFRADVLATRQALEASLPALAGALRESGLTLTGGSVFQQPQGQPQGADGQAGQTPPRRTGSAADEGHATGLDGGPRGVALQRGLVDLVA